MSHVITKLKCHISVILPLLGFDTKGGRKSEKVLFNLGGRVEKI